MGDLVFVPVTSEELRSARRDGLGQMRGFAPTQRLLDTFGYGPEEGEEAEYAACLIASVDALVRHGHRLVLAVGSDDAEPDLGPDADFGLVSVPSVAWRHVQSIFADEPAGDAAAQDLHLPPVEGDATALDAAWGSDAVHELLEAHDLLWFGPSEADRW